MKQFIEKLGGRKLILSLLVLVGSTLLLYFGKVDSESFYSLIKVVVGAYLGGNVLQAGVVKKAVDRKVEMAEELLETVTQGQALADMGGRKFMFVIGIYLLAVILLLIKTIDAGAYVDITNYLVGVYVLANVGQKAVEQGVTISVNKT